MSSHSGGVTPPGGQEISCSCGATRFVCTGKPIMVSECYCDSCRKAGAIQAALPGAEPVLEASSGTLFVLHRKDRIDPHKPWTNFSEFQHEYQCPLLDCTHSSDRSRDAQEDVDEAASESVFRCGAGKRSDGSSDRQHCLFVVKDRSRYSGNSECSDRQARLGQRGDPAAAKAVASGAGRKSLSSSICRTSEPHVGSVLGGGSVRRQRRQH